MGQYHWVVNLTKRELLHPHRCGDGLKLMEFGPSGDGTMACLAILLACSNGRGGGDCRANGELAKAIIGRWAGDEIAIVGDYAEVNDIPGKTIPIGDQRAECVDISEHAMAVLALDGIEPRESWCGTDPASRFVAPSTFVAIPEAAES